MLISQAAEAFVLITVKGHLLGYASPFGSELFTFSPAREDRYKCQGYCSCASWGAACRTPELWSSSQGCCRLPSLPISSFSFSALALLWASRGVWCGAAVGSAGIWCCCVWCELSTVTSTKECLHLDRQWGVCVRGSCCAGIWGGLVLLCGVRGDSFYPALQ